MKLVYFGAEWCNVCKSMYPLVKEEMLKHGIPENSAKFEYVDVDQEADRTNYNNICNLPTMIIEDDNGNAVDHRVGMLNKADIVKFCSRML